MAWDADLHQDSILFYTLQVEEQEGSKLGRISLTQRWFDVHVVCVGDGSVKEL